MSMIQEAEAKLEEAKAAAANVASHQEQALMTLYNHFLRAHLEMARGVSEVLSNEISRVEKEEAARAGSKAAAAPARPASSAT